MPLTTADVVGLLALVGIFLAWAWHVRRTLRILNDPEHPDHELVKEAVLEEDPNDPFDPRRPF